MYASDTSPSLFNRYRERTPWINAASTAYQRAPGGTRRQDEARAAAAPPATDPWRSFWNPEDAAPVRDAWSRGSAGGSSADRGTRFAGSIFSGDF